MDYIVGRRESLSTSEDTRYQDIIAKEKTKTLNLNEQVFPTTSATTELVAWNYPATDFTCA